MVTNFIKTMTKTKWNYLLSFYFDAAVAFIMLFLAFSGETSLSNILGLFFIGAFIFTFIEYVFHAWLFHGSIKIFVQGHAAHHRDPYGYDGLPFFVGAAVAVVVAMLISLIVSFAVAMAIGSGILFGYLAYGVMHHLMHRKDYKNSYYQYMMKLHETHHKDIRMNHGVTTPIWDIVFRTYKPNL